MPITATRGIFWAILSSIVLGGCGAESEQPGLETEIAPGESEQAITGGVKIPTSDLPTKGVVQINTASSLNCSGVLITDRWVLTAAHCLCASDVSAPSSLAVSVYGKDARAEDPGHAPFYTTTATLAVKNASWDVALIKLAQTLPFTAPPAIYTGNGSNLVGKSVTQYGFGTDGPALRTISAIIDRRIEAPFAFAKACPGEGATSFRVDGPGIKPPNTQEGDSGGPLFLANNVLVGILSGVRTEDSTSWDYYTGLWAVRDWIKQQTALEIPMPSTCSVTLPSSAGNGPPAVAEAADGIHVFASQADNTIGHWLFNFGGAAKVGTVPGASVNSTDAVGAALERSGSKLGLAWRDRTSTRLKYARLSTDGTWSTATSGPTGALGAGPAMAKKGPIAVLKADGKVAAVFFDAVAGTFGTYMPLPASAPLADLGKRISVVYDDSAGVTTLGYRKTNGEFVWSVGTLACPTYFCGTQPAIANSWLSAMLGFVPGQRLSLVTADSNGALKNRVLFDAAYPWGAVPFSSLTQPGIAQIGGNLMFAGTLPFDGSIVLSRTENCFANQF